MVAITERDLTVAERLGSIDQNLKNLNETLEKEREALWGVINVHAEKIEGHSQSIADHAATMRTVKFFVGLGSFFTGGIEAIRSWGHK